MECHFAIPTCIFLYSVEEEMPRLRPHKQPVVWGERETVNTTSSVGEMLEVGGWMEDGGWRSTSTLTPCCKTVNLDGQLLQDRNRLIGVVHG